MAVSIPASGNHTFVIPMQNMVELNRLLSTKSAAYALFLTINGDRVAFYDVMVLDILPVPASQGVDVISVRLLYAWCRVTPAAMLDALRAGSLLAFTAPSGGQPGLGLPIPSSTAAASQQLYQQQANDIAQAQAIFSQVVAEAADRQAEQRIIAQQSASTLFQITQQVTQGAAMRANNTLQGALAFLM